MVYYKNSDEFIIKFDLLFWIKFWKRHKFNG
mgnify:CR=1 FL=1